MRNIELQYKNDNDDWIQVRVYKSALEMDNFETDLDVLARGLLAVGGSFKCRLVMVSHNLFEVLCIMHVRFLVPYGEMSNVIANFFKG